jgi:phospholipid/cholesterol/gamma-HCH transport system substrate-binding protein
MALVDALPLLSIWISTMETNVRYTIAGIFVLTLILCIVFAVIFIASGFNTKPFTYFKVNMEESVSGLSLDGPVEFNGVKVGTVAEMKINHENPQLVELLLKVDDDTPVTVGTRAKLGVRSLTGVTYILLEDKGNNMQPLKKEEGQKYAVIPTTPSILVRLDTTLTQINDSFRQLSASIRALLDKQNLQWIKQILQSGKGSLQIIETQTLPSANQAVENMGTFTNNLNDFSEEIKQDPAILLRGKARATRLGPGEK